MLGVAGSHHYRALVIQQLCDGFLRCARRGETTVEDVSLTLDLSGNGLHPDRDADDAIGKSNTLEMSANQSHPRLVARRRSGGTHQMLEALAIGERENHHHLS